MATLRHKVIDTTPALGITGIPVLHGAVFHFCTVVHHNFHNGRVQLVLVTHRSRTPFQIRNVRIIIRHNQGSFELPRIAGIDAEFYSVAVTNNHQQADTGTKMIHLGKNTRSTIVSKGISAGKSENSYRGLVRVAQKADNARNYSQCDSLLLGDKCGAHTFPYMDIHNETAIVEHEATTSKISEDQIFYCNQRGISTEDAVGLIVNGYAKEVLNKLPMEFAVEAQKLLAISLEGSVG